MIKKSGTNIPEQQALDYVLGYTVGNDISHRHWQLEAGGGQWNFGKGFDKLTPWGPGIVRPDVFPLDKDPGLAIGEKKGLRLWTKINGELVQEGWTGEMIFGVAKTISFLSQGTTLSAGDLIFMGTPAGVGMAKDPPRWLRHGDVVEVGLEGVGSCVNEIQFQRDQEDEEYRRQGEEWKKRQKNRPTLLWRNRSEDSSSSDQPQRWNRARLGDPRNTPRPHRTWR